VARGASVILDYSQSGLPRPRLGCWFRALWSHRARLHLAHTASVWQAFGILAAVSLLGSVLTHSHTWLHDVLVHLLQPRGGFLQWVKAEFSHAGGALGHSMLQLAPWYFGGMLAILGLVASFWTSAPKGRNWVHCFAVLSVACVPALWLFLLLQAEGIAPFVTDPAAWQSSWWNPVTNGVRFAVLMVGLLLLALWIVDAGKLCRSLQQWKKA